MLINKKYLELALKRTTTPPRTIDNVRKTRNMLLAASDWTQNADSPLTAEKRAEWSAYRQALRDITEQDINNIIWPNQPV